MASEKQEERNKIEKILGQRKLMRGMIGGFYKKGNMVIQFNVGVKIGKLNLGKI